MRWRPGLGLTILAVVVVALGLLAVTGRMLAPDPAVPPITAGSVQPSQTSTSHRVMVPEPMVTWTPRPLPAEVPLEASTSRGVVVPDVVGKSLAEGQRLMRRAGLHGSANERDPQAPGSVIFAQEPPPGMLVPPGSVVGFRTKRPA
jgi:PASTA domain